jgi:hypothetical protein
MSIGIKGIADTLEKYMTHVEFPKAGAKKYLKLTKDKSTNEYTLKISKKFDKAKCDLGRIAKKFKESSVAGTLGYQIRQAGGSTDLNGVKLDQITRMQKAIAKLSEKPAATKGPIAWLCSILFANPVKDPAYKKIAKALNAEIQEMRNEATSMGQTLPEQYITLSGQKAEKAILEKRLEKMEKLIENEKLSKAKAKAPKKKLKSKIEKLNTALIAGENLNIAQQTNPYRGQVNRGQVNRGQGNNGGGSVTQPRRLRAIDGFIANPVAHPTNLKQSQQGVESDEFGDEDNFYYEPASQKRPVNKTLVGGNGQRLRKIEAAADGEGSSNDGQPTTRGRRHRGFISNRDDLLSNKNYLRTGNVPTGSIDSDDEDDYAVDQTTLDSNAPKGKERS